MPSAVADTVKALNIEPSVSSPFPVPEESNMAYFELFSPQIETPDTLIRATSDPDSSPSTDDLSNIAPSNISTSDGQVFSASLENPLGTALSPHEVNTPIPEAGETHSPQSSEPTALTKDISAMGSSYLSTDVSISTSDLPTTNMFEEQEPFNSAESSLDTDLSHKATEISNMLPTEAASTELPELPFGSFLDEDAREAASPSDILDASDTLVEAMAICSPKAKDLSSFSKDQTDMKSSPSEVGLADIPSEVNEISSAGLLEVGNSNNSLPRGKTSGFAEDQSGLNSFISEAGHANMTSGSIELTPTESAETRVSNHSESSIEASNMAPCFPSAETATDVAEPLKFVLNKVIECNQLPKVSNELVPMKVEVLDAKVKIESIETSSTDIPELDLAATGARDESSSFSILEDSTTIVSGRLEDHSEIREQGEPAEVTSDIDFAPVSVDGSGKGLEPMDENMTDLPDSSPATEETMSKEIISLPLGSSTALNRTLKASLTESRDVLELQEIFASENDTTSVLDSMASAVNDLNNASDLLYTIANEVSNSAFSLQCLNTTFPSEGTDINSKVAERSETIQPETADETRSASTSPLSSPQYSFADTDFEYMSGEADTTHLQNLNLSNAAILEMDTPIVKSVTILNRFDLNGLEVTEQLAFEKSLPNFPFSAEQQSTGCEANEDELSAMDFEDAGRRSPEIKVEPMAMDDIPYPNTPLSSMDSSTLLQELVQSSSVVEVEEFLSEASLDTVTSADTKTLDTDGENFRAILSEAKLETDNINVDQDTQSRNMGKGDKAKSPRKRAQSPNTNEMDFQTPPAKKLCQESHPARDSPKIKTEDGVSGCPEENETAHLLVQRPVSSTGNKRAIMSPPSTPPFTELDQICTIEKHKKVPTATSASTKILRPAVKKNSANDTIELCIGPSRKCVLAHRYILAKSPFFASLMSKYPDAKKTPQAYHFQKFDTYAFATVIHWLYHGNIRLVAEDYKADEIFNTTHMVKVYCLCVKLQLRSLRNLAIELLGHGYLKNDSAPSIEEIDIAYSETEDEPSLRFYLATWAQCRQHAPLQKYMMAVPWNRDRFKTLCKKHPDLAVHMECLHKSITSVGLKSINPRFHDICWYHEHPEGERCGVANQTFESACNGFRSRISEAI